MTHQFDVIVEKDSAGYFIASVPALPGCHTQAKSLDELMERIREAIELCLEVQGDVTEPLDVAAADNTHGIGEQDDFQEHGGGYAAAPVISFLKRASKPDRSSSLSIR